MTATDQNLLFNPQSIMRAKELANAQEIAKPVWLKVLSWAGAPLLVIAVLTPFLPALFAWVAASDLALTAPDFSLLADMPLAVQLHLATVMIALPLGGFILWRPKGTGLHKVLGRIWVASMAITCVSALFIKSFAPMLGPFGFIHLLVLWTLYSLARGMWAILVNQDLPNHLRNMQGAYWGLIIAGVFSAIPGRLIWSMFTTM
jgi:uncharacterized membrane protein